MLLLMSNPVLLHTCCSVDVTDVSEVHILIDEIHLRESCCDVSEDLSMISRHCFWQSFASNLLLSRAASVSIGWLIHGFETISAPGYRFYKPNVGSE